MDKVSMKHRAFQWQRLYNVVANLAHLSGDHCDSALEDEAHDLIRELRQADTWQPIETAPVDVRVLLYSPPENLHLKPAGQAGDLRVSTKRFWTWATHWMPLPDPPAATTKPLPVNAHALTLEFHRFLTEDEWRAVIAAARAIPQVKHLVASAVRLSLEADG